MRRQLVASIEVEREQDIGSEVGTETEVTKDSGIEERVGGSGRTGGMGNSTSNRGTKEWHEGGFLVE